MAEKMAADLKPGDVVEMPGGDRVVDHIEFTDRPVDSSGTTGVRVVWGNHPRPNILAADKELTVLGPKD